MTLMQRVAGMLHFGDRGADLGEHTELTLQQQMDRLADSRSVVEHDLAQAQQLADRLEAEGRKANAAGRDDKARALSDRRGTVLIRISELRAAHRALTEAIMQRSTAVTRLRNQEAVVDESPLLTSDDINAALDHSAEVERHEAPETHIEVNG